MTIAKCPANTNLRRIVGERIVAALSMTVFPIKLTVKRSLRRFPNLMLTGRATAHAPGASRWERARPR
jgi:hypothetical protein